MGVEGISDEIILNALKECMTPVKENAAKKQLTKSDLCMLGLSGTPDSHTNRTKLLKRLKLPVRLSSNAMLDVLNSVYSYHEIVDILSELSIK